MAGFLEKIYKVSPIMLQNAGVNLYGLLWRHRRFGGDFLDQVARFRERESFTEADWTVYQQAELRRLLQTALDVPYYREALSHLFKTPADVERFELSDLHQLPLLSKETIRARAKEFIHVKSPKLYAELTSGTTGTPLEIKFSASTYKKISAAYETRCRNWAGVHWRMSRGMIGGRLVVPSALGKPPFWRYNIIEKQLYLSAFHISPQNARAYADALNRFKPDYLVGYAVSHFLLARFIAEKKIEMYRPRAILTSSEKLTQEMRDTLESVYQCNVFDAYSGVEACCLASECEHHRLHVSPDVGIIELLDENNKPVPPGTPGQIVATGLLNPDQPLIRYQTGDWAVWSTEKCPCGRGMPVLEELIGRLEDIVVAQDGRQLVRFHGIFIGLPHIREGQVIQETPKDFCLRLVVDALYGVEDERCIRERFEERLGKINLRIEKVDNIERTSRGKFRAVVSRVHTKNVLEGQGDTAADI